MNAFDHADYNGIEDVWPALGEWHTLRERIDRLEAVRQDRGADSSFEENAA